MTEFTYMTRTQIEQQIAQLRAERDRRAEIAALEEEAYAEDAARTKEIEAQKSKSTKVAIMGSTREERDLAKRAKAFTDAGFISVVDARDMLVREGKYALLRDAFKGKSPDMRLSGFGRTVKCYFRDNLMDTKPVMFGNIPLYQKDTLFKVFESIASNNKREAIETGTYWG